MSLLTDHSLLEAEVDLSAIRHNYKLLSAMSPDLEGMAVVKANAYGHGVENVAHDLQNAGVKWFGVATLDEAVQIRRIGIKGRVLVFASPLAGDLDKYLQHDLDLCLATMEMLRNIVEDGREFRVHLKVDTGMGRLGLTPAEFESNISSLAERNQIKLIGLISHLAEAEENEMFSEIQMTSFAGLVEKHGQNFEFIHLANSAGVARFRKQLNLGRPGLSRMGIGLYGYGIPNKLLRESEKLIPALTLKTRITSIKTLGPGESVSYGRTWVATEPTRIATIACGYADGYPRLFSNWTHVKIRDVSYDLVGTICMDMMMVNLGQNRDIEAGEAVELFGPNGPFVAQMSQIVGTIPYELLSGLGQRAKKVFINPC